MSFIRLIVLPTSSSLRIFFFNLKECWTLSSGSFVVVCIHLNLLQVFILSLLIYWIMMIDLVTLNYCSIPETKPAWSWCIILLIFYYVLFGSSRFRCHGYVGHLTCWKQSVYDWDYFFECITEHTIEIMWACCLDREVLTTSVFLDTGLFRFSLS